MKPIVHCNTVGNDGDPEVGYSAVIITYDHPATHRVTAGHPVLTSPVVVIFEGGFETQNTRYVYGKPPVE